MPAMADKARAQMRKQRTKRGWSFAALNAAIGGCGVKTSRGYLQEIETGDKDPSSLDLVIAIEEVLGVPAESWPQFTGLPRLFQLRKAS